MTRHLKVVPLIDKSENNAHWSARQALEELLADPAIDKTKHLLVIYLHELPNGDLKFARLRAGVKRTEEIAYLSMALHNQIEDMKD